MDTTAIFALIEKGLTVVGSLIAAAANAGPAIEALMKLANGGQTGTVTDADLAKTEALLDGLIDDFNIEMP